MRDDELPNLPSQREVRSDLETASTPLPELRRGLELLRFRLHPWARSSVRAAHLRRNAKMGALAKSSGPGRVAIIMPETEEERATVSCFVAFCGNCGNIIACTVKLPERATDNAMEVGRWVRAGLTINTIPVSAVRTGQWCKCPGKRIKLRD